MLEGEPIHVRSAKEFELSKAYKDKIKVENIITAPEIEMLVICNEKKYTKFKRTRKKASDYCKDDLKMSKIKSRGFIKEYFSDIDSLIWAIKDYNAKANTKNGEYTLNDLLE